MGAKTIQELESSACKYWTPDIAKKVIEANPIQQLVKTQDQFLSILKSADRSPESWYDVAKNSSTMPANVFVKHLMVLSDIGGECLKRFARDFSTLFPDKSFSFVWKGVKTVYQFKADIPRWSNNGLRIDKDHLFDEHPFSDSMKDACMLLLWGSSIVEPEELPVDIREKCVIGQMIGTPELLEKFVRQRYLYVSRIIGGSSSNDSGHICEESCFSRLQAHLKPPYAITGHHIEGISQNGKDPVTFDFVVTNQTTKKCCGIEISFRVTTNSVIERKALLAQDRQTLLHGMGHCVAYIIDGAGNFERRSAVEGIMRFSDCTVNFSNDGIAELAHFIMETI